jgi:hypothetical protein
MGAVPAFNPLQAGISAGVSLATDAANLWLSSIQQSHAQDTAATTIANQFGAAMANLDKAYLSEPAPSCADQRAALNAFDAAWAFVQSPQGCGNGAFGSAGARCIAERAPGGIYDATRANRDPIANDPRLANQCDTGVSVLLPDATGAYVPTGLTTTGGSAASGQTAAQLTAAIPAAPVAAIPATNPNYTLYLAAGLAALLVAKTL